MVGKARGKRKIPQVELIQKEPLKIEISFEKVSRGQLYNRKNDLGWYLYQMTGGRRR